MLRVLVIIMGRFGDTTAFYDIEDRDNNNVKILGKENRTLYENLKER